MLEDATKEVIDLLLGDLDYDMADLELGDSPPKIHTALLEVGDFIDHEASLSERTRLVQQQLETLDVAGLSLSREWLLKLMTSAEVAFRDHPSSVKLSWRRAYTDSVLILTCMDVRVSSDIAQDRDEKFWESLIARLDSALIVAGAPGKDRRDMTQMLIKLIQREHLPVSDDILRSASSRQTKSDSAPVGKLQSASQPIPEFRIPVSLSAFITRHCKSPFILKSFVSDWPALTNWSSHEYLLKTGGRGRIVPVEVGSDYTAPDWHQRFISWESFLSILFETDNDQVPSSTYLAQHSLFNQMPELRADISIPDYVYASPPAPEYFPEYKPPSNEEGLVINAWIGLKGTISPAHTDPYYNCFAQVVGRKTVWVAPPDLSKTLKSYSDTHSLSNTSSIDVFATPDDGNTDLLSEISTHAMYAVLEPGDLLYLPPKWWHAMRSEDTSASVSMWF